uniref:EGF-like domain-containing protein n=1 Tax=Neogobius melanostomus TaxID=47308 RepID=A0A8C6WMM5_9GOBI
MECCLRHGHLIGRNFQFIKFWWSVSSDHKKLLESQSNVTFSHIASDPYVAVLQSGFTGDMCEVDIDECEGSPCENGGTCRNNPGGFHCECKTGFSGTVCSIDIEKCLKMNCQNNGTCVHTDDSYYCQCIPGFEGLTCERAIDYCMSSPCVMGSCINLKTTFSCLCPAGKKICTPSVKTPDTGLTKYLVFFLFFLNKSCPRAKISPCYNNPCQNDGMCLDNWYEYLCDCRNHFTGKNCSQGKEKQVLVSYSNNVRSELAFTVLLMYLFYIYLLTTVKITLEFLFRLYYIIYVIFSEVSEELAVPFSGSDSIEFLIKEQFRRDYLLKVNLKSEEEVAEDFKSISIRFKTKENGVLVIIFGQTGFNRLQVGLLFIYFCFVYTKSGYNLLFS